MLEAAGLILGDRCIRSAQYRKEYPVLMFIAFFELHLHPEFYASSR
jgi:hypothetical protein